MPRHVANLGKYPLPSLPISGAAGLASVEWIKALASRRRASDDRASSSSQPASMGNYARFGKFLGGWPDMNIFRRFGSLQAQNMLFLQAELAHLEDQLNEIREEQRSNVSDDPEKEQEKLDRTQSWRALQDAGEDSDEYLQLMKIREKLNEYSTADCTSLVGSWKHQANCPFRRSTFTVSRNM